MSGERAFSTGMTKASPGVSFLAFILVTAILVQVFFSWNNYLPTWFWFQELSINLSVYWLFLHVLTLCVLFLARRRLHRLVCVISAIALTAFSAGYLYQMRGFLFYPEPPPLSSSAHKLKVLQVSAFKASLTELAGAISSQQPDLLAVTGLEDAAAESLELSKKFPYVESVQRGDEFSIALYSRFPLTSAQTSIGERLPPIVSTSIAPAGAPPVQVLFIHAPSPFVRAAYRDHKLVVRRTSTALRQTKGPLLVLGNFNATEFSGSYKRFRNAGKLKNAMTGYGYFRTADPARAWYRLSLDHIMYRDMQSADFRRLPDIGADRYPISATFAW